MLAQCTVTQCRCHVTLLSLAVEQSADWEEGMYAADHIYKYVYVATFAQRHFHRA